LLKLFVRSYGYPDIFSGFFAGEVTDYYILLTQGIEDFFAVTIRRRGKKEIALGHEETEKKSLEKRENATKDVVPGEAPEKEIQQTKDAESKQKEDKPKKKLFSFGFGKGGDIPPVCRVICPVKNILGNVFSWHINALTITHMRHHTRLHRFLL